MLRRQNGKRTVVYSSRSFAIALFRKNRLTFDRLMLVCTSRNRGGPVQKLQASVVYWTPVSGFRLTFPHSRSYLKLSLSLTVLIVYDHFGDLSTKNFPKKPVDKRQGWPYTVYNS